MSVRKIEIQAHHLPTVAKLLTGTNPTIFARQMTRMYRYFNAYEYVGSSPTQLRIHQRKRRKAYKTYATIKDTDEIIIHSKQDLICSAANDTRAHCPPTCQQEAINPLIIVGNNMYAQDVLEELKKQNDIEDKLLSISEVITHSNQTTPEIVIHMSGKTLRRLIVPLYT